MTWLNNVKILGARGLVPPLDFEMESFATCQLVTEENVAHLLVVLLHSKIDAYSGSSSVKTIVETIVLLVECQAFCTVV